MLPSVTSNDVSFQNGYDCRSISVTLFLQLFKYYSWQLLLYYCICWYWPSWENIADVTLSFALEAIVTDLCLQCGQSWNVSGWTGNKCHILLLASAVAHRITARASIFAAECFATKLQRPLKITGSRQRHGHVCMCIWYVNKNKR